MNTGCCPHHRVDFRGFSNGPPRGCMAEFALKPMPAGAVKVALTFELGCISLPWCGLRLRVGLRLRELLRLRVRLQPLLLLHARLPGVPPTLLLYAGRLPRDRRLLLLVLLLQLRLCCRCRLPLPHSNELLLLRGLWEGRALSTPATDETIAMVHRRRASTVTPEGGKATTCAPALPATPAAGTLRAPRGVPAREEVALRLCACGTSPCCACSGRCKCCVLRSSWRSCCPCCA